MSAPVQLDFSKAQPLSLDFSKAQPIGNGTPPPPPPTMSASSPTLLQRANTALTDPALKPWVGNAGQALAGGIKDTAGMVGNVLHMINTPGAMDTLGATPEQAAEGTRQVLASPVHQHIEDAANWLRSGGQPDGFWENVGMVGAETAQWFGGSEALKLAGKVGEAVDAVEHLAQAQKVTKVLADNPKLAGLVTIGLKASKDALGAAALNYAHTGDPRSALTAGATTAVLGAGIEGIGGAARGAGEDIANRTIESGGRPQILPKKATPTATQAAGQTAIRENAQGMLGAHLDELNESRTPEPGAAAGQPYTFTLKGNRDLQDASAQGSRVIGRAMPASTQPALPGKVGVPGSDFTIAGTPVREVREGQSVVPAAPLPRENMSGQLTDPTGSGQRIPSRVSNRRAFMTSADVDTAPTRGTTGADVSTGRPIPTESLRITGGGTLTKQEEGRLAAHLGELNRAIADPGFGALPKEQQAQVFQAKSNALAQLAEHNASLSDVETPHNQNRFSYSPAETEPAQDQAVRGSGELKTQDPTIARSHLAATNEIVNSPEFAKMAPARQQAILEARGDTARQLDEYWSQQAAARPGAGQAALAPVNVAQTIRNVGSHTEAADQFLSTLEDGYDEIAHRAGLTGQSLQTFNAVKNAYKDAEEGVRTAAGDEQLTAAETNASHAHEQLIKFLDSVGMTPKEVGGIEQGYSNYLKVRDVAKAIDGSFNINPYLSRNSGLYRGFSGDKLQTKLSKLTDKYGPAELQRVMGPNGMTEMMNVAQLNSTRAGAAQYGEKVNQVAQYLQKMGRGAARVVGAGAGAAAGHAVGLPGWQGYAYGAAGGAALAEAGIYSAKAINEAIMSNPAIAQNVLFWIKSGARRQYAVPMIAGMIQRAQQAINPTPQGTQ